MMRRGGIDGDRIRPRSTEIGSDRAAAVASHGVECYNTMNIWVNAEDEE